MTLRFQMHSGKSATIRESNHGSGVCKEHYPSYYVSKSSILLAGTGVWKMIFVACGFSSNPKSLISRITEVYVFSIKYCYRDILLKKHKLHLSCLFCCNHNCYCVNMVSVTSSSRNITSASFYHPYYQSRSSMYMCGLIAWTFTELADAVPIDFK